MKKGLILGFFDGLHIAHKAVVASAREYSDVLTVITFKDSPAKFFNKEFDYIMPRSKTINKMKELGVSEIIELDFSTIAHMTAEEYLEFLIQNFKPVSISTGYNHTFGKNRSGNPDFLAKNSAKYGYKYICIPPQKLDNCIISSTLIRNLLKQGEIIRANQALGSNFSIYGKVIKGAQLGQKIGFPTANINYPQELVKIPFGVYATRVRDKHAVLNWGMKPTVKNTKEPVAEVHIIDFSGDLYNQNIEIEITKKIRNEHKFNNLEELKIQIEKDIIECLES